jgi:CheY-like chemotaxis protein
MLLAFSDTGCGMSAETKARLFEPFFTTKEQGKGTGLGLATVYGIVKQSDGSIWVASQPGRGTTIEIYLPRLDAAPDSPAASSPASLPAAAGETILIVEDELSVRTFVRTVLTTLGYQVLESRSPEEALSASRRHEGPIHLLLTDVVMPGGNGRQVAECLVDQRPALKVLYMSGYTDNVSLRLGVPKEGRIFLQKPFTPLALAQRVRETLDARADQADFTRC